MKPTTPRALRWLHLPFLLWSLVFVLAPLGMVAVYAFTGAQGEPSLRVFASLLASPQDRASLVRIFSDSFFYALLATALCLVLAFPMAYYMARCRPRTQRMWLMLLMVPMWMNFLICTYSWRSILETKGILNTLLGAMHLPQQQWLNTPAAVVLGMVYTYLPFMILPLHTVMSRLSPSLAEAAHDLGAGSLQVLRRVVLPLSLPGMLSGILMVFVPSVSTFYISQKLGGNKAVLIGDRIELAFLTSYDYPTGAALSLLLMGVILLCLLLLRRVSDGEEGSFVA